jgi:hypothetical protein
VTRSILEKILREQSAGISFPYQLSEDISDISNRRKEQDEEEKKVARRRQRGADKINSAGFGLSNQCRAREHQKSAAALRRSPITNHQACE